MKLPTKFNTDGGMIYEIPMVARDGTIHHDTQFSYTDRLSQFLLIYASINKSMHRCVSITTMFYSMHERFKNIFVKIMWLHSIT